MPAAPTTPLAGDRWWYVTKGSLTGAVCVRADGIVTDAPPVFRWMLGRRWRDVKAGNRINSQPLESRS